MDSIVQEWPEKQKPPIEYYQIFVEDEAQQEGTYSTQQDEGNLPISHPDNNQESNATPTTLDLGAKRKAIGLVRKEKKKQKNFKDTTDDESNKLFNRMVGIAEEI